MFADSIAFFFKNSILETSCSFSGNLVLPSVGEESRDVTKPTKKPEMKMSF